MRKFFGLLIFCAFTQSSMAQDYKVYLEPAYNAFVSGEAVVVQLDLLNAGRDLVKVDPAKGGDQFVVEISYGQRYNELKPITTAPFCKSFELKPGNKFTSKLEIDKWYPLLKCGQYFIQLVFVHNGVRYESNKKSFDVVSGLPIKEGVQMFIRDQELKRVFKLVHWERNRAERLFLKIKDEPSGAVWDTIDLGTFLKTSDPKLDIDEKGEVKVVHRATQDAFFWTVLWSLPRSVEVAERNRLLDPEVSAAQRVRSLYGEDVEDGPGAEEKHWWKFW
ncbi:MAG: hypothetical protein PF904_02775 [Kiritimatiellae bacterium]|jgi:hypothetical protein|nr:hypothetical protein [Kiritimatiellia bacterium]